MDKSETYIKMCNCEEIQELCEWDMEKDFLWITPIPDKNMPLVKTVWLPRQDQLQEMVGGYDAGFVDWARWLDNTYPHKGFPKQRFHSFEQLWLAFVLKELYSKIWNGEEWV